jgi:MFS family permease
MMDSPAHAAVTKQLLPWLVADRFGTRRVFASAIGIFTLGSLLCGLSNNIQWLVLCRILQGCGGAMMIPVARLTLVRSFAKGELVRAMSFVSIPSLIGPMLGPLAGGLIVGYFHCTTGSRRPALFVFWRLKDHDGTNISRHVAS